MKHRRHRRVPARGVAAAVDALREGEYQIENISAGGMFLRTSTPMPIGMPVRVELTKPGLESALALAGRVVSVVTPVQARRVDVPPGVGIELDPMPIETEKKLHALLRALGLKDLAEPLELEPDSLYATASPDTQQVASNVRGLLEMLSDALHKVKERDEEILKLKAEIRQLKADRR